MGLAFRSALVVALLVASTRVTSAQPPKSPEKADAPDITDKARKLFEQGRKEYDLGEYKKALELFKEAHRVKDYPAFLLNIAQCHRLLGDYASAARSYRTYLRYDIKSRYRGEVEELAVEMEKQAAKAEQEAREAEKAKAAAEAAANEKTAGDKGGEQTPPLPQRPWTRDPVAISLVTIGAVSLLAGAGLFGWGGASTAAADSTSSVPERFDLQQQASTAFIGGGAVAGVGVVLLIGGGVRFALKKNSQKRAQASTALMATGR